MSLTDCSSAATEPKAMQNVGEHAKDGPKKPDDKSPEDVGDKCVTAAVNVRDRVLKQVGITSTAFIGPAVPPQKDTPRSDIEDSLSEFYKELDRVEKTDSVNGNREETDLKSQSRTTRDCPENGFNPCVSPEKDSHQKMTRQKQPWLHWYHNTPYSRSGSRPDRDTHCEGGFSQQNHRRPPQPPNGPPFYHQPPSYAFLSTQHSPPLMTPPFQAPHVPNPPPLPLFEGREFDSRSHYPNFREPGADQWSEMRANAQTHGVENGEDLWERRHHHEPPDWNQSRLHHPSPLLILMRGLPGSGKSTRARELLSTGPSGIILSTDDYFAHEYGYRYEPDLLGAAHEWNQRRARDALHDLRSPVIIDNTNLQAWEMKPYVKMALERGYSVDFCEPQTRWRFDPYELERRNKHRVDWKKIAQMMDRYSFPISVDIVMRSQEPPHVRQRRPPQSLKDNPSFR